MSKGAQFREAKGAAPIRSLSLSKSARPYDEAPFPELVEERADLQAKGSAGPRSLSLSKGARDRTVRRNLWTASELIHSPQENLQIAAGPPHPQKVPWTYILRCSDGSFYVGSAHHLENRVDQHNEGAVVGYTETRRPVELVWAHESERVDEAWALERKIKGWSRAKRIALIEGRFADLPGLSRSRSRPSAS